MSIKEIANFLAVHSTIETYPGSDFVSRVKRRLARYCYWGLVNLDTYFSHDQYMVEACVKKGIAIDAYPRLLKEIDAAHDEKYDGQIVDPANFCVCYATSYCAYLLKVFNHSSSWPTKPVVPRDKAHAREIAGRERAHDAKYWIEFLAAQGYTHIVDEPKDGNHYIGVNPNSGEYGLVVWFVKRSISLGPIRDTACVTSYVDKKFFCQDVNIAEYRWVEIT